VTTPNSPLDKSPLEERDVLAAHEDLRFLGSGVDDTIETVEAQLEAKSARELRAMVVAKILAERFELCMRHHRPQDGLGAINAYERFAGHLGLGIEEE
jgi:hypothetical protein